MISTVETLSLVLIFKKCFGTFLKSTAINFEQLTIASEKKNKQQIDKLATMGSIFNEVADFETAVS